MDHRIKREAMEPSNEVISLSSSSSSDYSGLGLRGFDEDESDVDHSPKKKQRNESVLPVGFLDPIRPQERTGGPSTNMNGAVLRNPRVLVKEERVENAKSASKDAVTVKATVSTVALLPSCRQFWKAGDYEGSGGSGNFSDEDMDHVRVHPKFLHSNATSHKWALGAFAELLDNALDEHCNGATYVGVDMLENMKDNSKMVLVQDNGGGMTPDKMRQCMSLGYSAKSKMANTIGQYGNGFKTSTMRLGADVVVFSRCQGKYGRSSTQTIGLLSFTFLRGTGKEDIVVPMVDYEKKGGKWCKYVKSSPECWQRNLETIIEWSPYESEEDLLQQFNFLSEQGTRIIIYNLWEDEEGSPELDFDTDLDDIQVRGSDRDQKNIVLAAKYPSCRHFLTYRHSLRSYASILYYRIPPGFRIILRGKDVKHHDIVDDLIHINELVYKPAAYADVKDPNMSAKVTLGFVSDAAHHLDVQGFNVYHKNRLIKPFWRVWSAAGSDGRGVVGVLQANFVEPAHDKQGFERTLALSRLEARLQHFQKNYWSSKCQLIGYAQRRHPKESTEPASPGVVKKGSSTCRNNSSRRVFYTTNGGGALKSMRKNLKDGSAVEATPIATLASERVKPCMNPSPLSSQPPLDDDVAAGDESLHSSSKHTLKQENNSLRLSLKSALNDLSYERDKYKALENQLEETKSLLTKMDQEQELFVCAFAEERGRRDQEEENLRRKLKDASITIEALLNKLKMLEASRN